MLSSYKRYPVVAGSFYPNNPDELKKMIKTLFLHRLGPGKEPLLSDKRRKNTIGYIAPHAGYIYSGAIAAHVYYEIAKDGLPDTIVIIGTNHTGLGSLVSIYPKGEWITPLGNLYVDQELAEKISMYSEIAELDTDAHLQEHSIEVQLPFIQYIYGNKISIVPIVLGIHTVEAAHDLAKAIKKAVDDLDRDIILIASSDFNHYDPYDVNKEKDMKAIKKILELDSKGFYQVIIDEHITVCGPGGIMTLIEYTRLINTETGCAELLKYANSGDVSGDKSAVVGYAAIKFYIK